MKGSKNKKCLAYILFACMVGFMLALTSYYNVQLFHIISEGFSITVGCIIFIIAWNSRKRQPNSFYIFLGTGYFFVAVLDFYHVVSYPGINILKSGGSNTAITLWIASRCIECFTFLCAFNFLYRKINEYKLFFIYLFLTAGILYLILLTETFPVLFIDGYGLTTVKKVSEYIISGILLLTFFRAGHFRKYFDNYILVLIRISLILTIFSEFSFTLYKDVYGLMNIMGHFFKAASFFCVYKALVVTSIKKPLEVLYRDLFLRDEKLEELNSTLIDEAGERERIQKELEAYKEHLEDLVDKKERSLKDTNSLLKEAVESGKLLENAFRLSEQKYLDLYNNTRDIYFCIDAEEGIIENCNKAASVTLGLKKEELTGRSVFEFCSEDTVDILKNEVLKGLKRDMYIENDRLELINKVGKTIAVSMKAASVFNEEGKTVSYHIGFQDITKQRLTAHENIKLVAAVEQIEEAIVVTDRQANILYTNPAFEKITGYSQEEVLGRNPRMLQSGEHDEQFYKVLWDTITAGKVWNGLIQNRKKDGSLYFEDNSISPISGDDGRIDYYVGIKKDVTRDIELEKKMREGQKLEAIGTLAGGIAHDFNNILFAIMGNIELVLHNVKNEVNKKRLNQVLNSAHRARNLIRQILTFSRRGDKNLKPVHIGSVVKDSIDLLKSTLPDMINLQFHSDLGDVEILAEEIMIQQVVMNLCTNSAYVLKENGGDLEVLLYSRRPDEERPVVLSVKDNGPGMSPDVLERIFEPFFTTKEPGAGTGLGLSVVYGIVTSCGGDITVSSDEGTGTEVVVRFPEYSSDENGTQEKEHSEDFYPESYHILIVEDDEMIAEIEGELIRSLGYQASVFTDPLEAVSFFRDNRDSIDLVFTDYSMPRKNGREVAEEICRERKVPVVVVSGYGDMPDDRSSDCIARSISKPLKREEIRDVLYWFLSGKKS